MTNAPALLPKPPFDGQGTPVRRPHPLDDVGAALECAFAPRRMLPGDLAAALGKLNEIA